METINYVIKKSYKKSICAWCNDVIGIFPIDNNVDIVSHGICKICLNKCLLKDKIKQIALNNLKS